MTTKGAFLAAAVAGLFASATPTVASAKEAAAKVHCQGVNACKGKGGCKGADNGCKGQNGCKGKGWKDMTEAQCTKKGGTVAAPEADKK
jgi:uncharacterized membrane protein